MEDVNLSLEFQRSIDQTLAETYEDLYRSLLESDNISPIRGTKSTLERMICHFSFLEEYEKCAFVKKVMEKYSI
jgi:hypothetical protein